MPNLNYIEKIYSWEEGSVKDFEEYENTFLIHVEFKRQNHSCPACANITNKIKDYRLQRVKLGHLNGKNAYAVVNKRRYYCEACNKSFAEKSFVAPKYQRRSQDELCHIISECSQKQSFTDIANRYGVSVTTVIRYFSQISIGIPTSLPETLSMDEFKGNAHGQKYQVAICDAGKNKIIDILPKRKTEDIIKYFVTNFSREERMKVKTVVIDLSMLFRKVIKTVFPCASIVADRFHVSRLVNWAMKRVRKNVQNKLRHERIYFKRSKYLINKAMEKLTEEESIKLEIMLSKSQALRRAYILKECFRTIFKLEDKDRKEFLTRWLDLVKASELEEFNRVLTTFSEWSNEIINALVSKHSNGYIEGHNNKIKVLKRLSFGIKNFFILRARILYLA